MEQYGTFWKFSDKSKSIQIMNRLVRGWDAIWPCFDKAPCTCREWYDNQLRIQRAISSLSFQVPRLPPQANDGSLKYTTSWTIRSVFLLLMQIEGISALKVCDLSLYLFTRMNPDQSGALSRVFRAYERTEKLKTVRDLMKLVGRKQRLLSAEIWEHSRLTKGGK
jgi:hypothetical protein